MYKIKLFLFLFVSNGVRCWIINNIDYVQLEERMGVDYENSLGDDLAIEGRLSLIYPGTKWCGAGNIAENVDDVGESKETDLCCREHDFCPDLISGGEMKHNLTNTAFYSRLSCDCDDKFRQCLHAANETSSKQIGKIYFNLLGTKCFRNDYPVTGCKRRGGWLRRKCLEYEYDTTKEKQYQWFDVPNY